MRVKVTFHGRKRWKGCHHLHFHFSMQTLTAWRCFLFAMPHLYCACLLCTGTWWQLVGYMFNNLDKGKENDNTQKTRVGTCRYGHLCSRIRNGVTKETWKGTREEKQEEAQLRRKGTKEESSRPASTVPLDHGSICVLIWAKVLLDDIILFLYGQVVPSTARFKRYAYAYPLTSAVDSTRRGRVLSGLASRQKIAKPKL